MIVVYVAISSCPYKLTRHKIKNFRKNAHQKTIWCNIKRNSQKHVCASLIKLTAKFFVLYVKLKHCVAWRQSHFFNFVYIPGAYYMSSAVGVVFKIFNYFFYLVFSSNIFTPRPPLFSINRTQLFLCLVVNIAKLNALLVCVCCPYGFFIKNVCSFFSKMYFCEPSFICASF